MRRQTTVWLSSTAIFSAFSAYFFGNFGDEASVIAICSLSSAFQWSQNAWPWMTLNGYFALNSVFEPVWLAPTVQRSKNNCVKTNKVRHILSAAQIFSRTLVSGGIRFVRIFAELLWKGDIKRTCCGRMLKFITCVRCWPRRVLAAPCISVRTVGQVTR